MLVGLFWDGVVANVDLKSHICCRYQFSYMEFQCKSGAVSPTVI